MIFPNLRRNPLSLAASQPRTQKKNLRYDITRLEMRRIFALVPRVALVVISAAVLAACDTGKAANTGPAISLTPQSATIKSGASTSLVLQTSSATSCEGTSGISGPQPVNGTI